MQRHDAHQARRALDDHAVMSSDSIRPGLTGLSQLANRTGGLPLNDACAGTRFTYSCQASTEHFEQCAEFALLRNRGLGALAVTVLAIALARRAAATTCAAVQSAAPLFRRW
jgi:hypothetical protein